MSIEIKILPERILLGRSASFIAARMPGANGPQVIGPLWDEMSKEYFSMQLNRAEWPLGIGAMWNVGDGSDGEMIYFAGYEIFEIPENAGNLEVLTLDEDKYACVTHVGPMAELSNTISSFYSTSLPESGLARRPGMDLEVYEEVGEVSRVVIAAPIA